MKPNYKLVCWGDFSIPVPVDHNWLSWDEDGACYTSKNKPIVNRGWVVWVNPGTSFVEKMNRFVGMDITPPEPGPWNKQLYWIG